MGRLSDSLIAALLDAEFGAAAFVASGSHAIALSTTLPTNTGGNVTEPVGGSYARKVEANTAATWPLTGADRAKANGIIIAFVTPTGAWGTVTHFAIYDTSAAPVFKAWGALTTARTIASGDPVEFAVGALTILGTA